MGTWDPEVVRSGAVAELAPWGIVPPDDLPRLAVGGQVRSVGDVVGRAQALHAVLDIIHGAPVDGTYAAVAAAGADRWITAAERAYLAGLVDGVPDVDAEYRLSWRAEGLYALVWMLGVAPDLPLTRALDLRPGYFQPVDAALGPAPPDLELRPVAEVAARLDVLFCAQWAVEEQVLEDWPADLEPDAIGERLRALEWYLVPGREWDDVRLDA